MTSQKLSIQISCTELIPNFYSFTPLDIDGFDRQYQEEQDNERRRAKTFNFKDAPQNRQLKMEIFDHVSSILGAVQSPINYNDIQSPINEGVLSLNSAYSAITSPVIEPDRTRTRTTSRYRTQKTAFSFGTTCRGASSEKMMFVAQNYAQTLEGQFTPIS
eukprot:387463_1